jgi:hypothetical protein
LSFSANLANNDVGDSEVIGVVRTVEDLEDQAEKSFDAQLRDLGTMFRFIYQDWGKIEALGSKLNNTKDPKWAWKGPGTTGAILDAMKPAVEVGYYRSILPTIYAAGVLVPPSDPDHYVSSSNPRDNYYSSYCDDFLQFDCTCIPWKPFSGYTSADQYLSWPEIDHPDRWDFLALGKRSIGDGGCKKQHGHTPYKTLAATVEGHLFNDLTVYKPYFYRRWEFPRVVCDPTGFDGRDWGAKYSKGCDWRNAKVSGPAMTTVIAPHSTDSPQLNPRVSTSRDTEEASTSLGTGGSPLSYSWEVLGGEATISNGDTATPNVEFTSGPGSYVVRVTVTNSNGAESTGETTVVYQEQ